jgi:serine phosphatase RsbU (regulator of sigma subunit)
VPTTPFHLVGRLLEAAWRARRIDFDGTTMDTDRRPMAEPEARRFDVGVLLAAVEDAPPVEAIDALSDLLRRTFHASDVAFLIADFSGRSLVRLDHGRRATAVHQEGTGARAQGRETAERVPLWGTAPGHALTSQAVVVEEQGDGGVRLFAPVTNRGEAIGVLEMRLPVAPDNATLEDVAMAAHALAYVVIANRRFTDLFTWGQRSVALSLAAEIQHRLLPEAYTCEAGQFTLAAWLEPAGEVAGDTFDFSLGRDHLHLSMTDAMGHSMDAAILATVLVGALRNARRAGVDLAEQARLANAALAEHAPPGGFVTGQVARIDLRAGVATIVNAGHPPPIRLRGGTAAAVVLEADPPFGAVAASAFRVQSLALKPGDRVFFFTDGMLERNAASLDIHALVETGAGLHPREAVQPLVRGLIDATQGDLRDDAATLCVEWHGGPPQARTTDAGANKDP